MNIVTKLSDDCVKVQGNINSMNVSAAAAVIISEVARQHHKN